MRNIKLHVQSCTSKTNLLSVGFFPLNGKIYYTVKNIKGGW